MLFRSDNVVTQTIASEGDGHWKEYAGGYSDWQRASATSVRESVRETARETARENPAARPQPDAQATKEGGSKPAQAPAAAPRQAKVKLNYKESRELAQIPDRITALENEQSSINNALADGSLFRDDPRRARAMSERLGAIDQELEQVLLRWEELESRQIAVP